MITICDDKDSDYRVANGSSDKDPDDDDNDNGGIDYANEKVLL